MVLEISLILVAILSSGVNPILLLFGGENESFLVVRCVRIVVKFLILSRVLNSFKILVVVVNDVVAELLLFISYKVPVVSKTGEIVRKSGV